MAQPEELLRRMRRNAAGHRRRDIVRVLEYHGYVFNREALHGSMYEHPELLEHPDRETRLSKARVMIPKGREMLRYVAEDVVASIDALRNFQKEKQDARR